MARRLSSDTDSHDRDHAARLSAVLSAGRRRAKISQQELAQRANISVGSVAKLESGRSPEPGFFLVARMASAISSALREDHQRHFDAEMRTFLGM